MNTDLFLKASRQKIRFETSKGAVTTEDLWDLPLSSNSGKANLDDIARGLHRGLKNSEDVSFVNRAATTNSDAQLRFDVVKFVIDTRLEENETASKARANSEKKQQILAIISQKENEKLAGSSLDELRALANSL